jgi:hypothetical protein
MKDSLIMSYSCVCAFMAIRVSLHLKLMCTIFNEYVL